MQIKVPPYCKDTIPKKKFETNIPRKEITRFSPNFYIHVSVSDLYIPTIGLPILLQETENYVDRSWEYIHHSQGLRPRNNFSGNTKMGFSLQCRLV